MTTVSPVQRLLFLLVASALFGGCSHLGRFQNLGEIERVDLHTKLQERYWAFVGDQKQELKHGPFTIFYEKGAVYITGNYSLGKLDGKYTVFSEDGKEVVVGWYVRGQMWTGTFLGGHQLWDYANGKRVRLYVPEDK